MKSNKNHQFHYHLSLQFHTNFNKMEPKQPKIFNVGRSSLLLLTNIKEDLFVGKLLLKQRCSIITERERFSFKTSLANQLVSEDTQLCFQKFANDARRHHFDAKNKNQPVVLQILSQEEKISDAFSSYLSPPSHINIKTQNLCAHLQPYRTAKYYQKLPNGIWHNQID